MDIGNKAVEALEGPQDVLLERMAHGGEAVGKLSDGRAVFVSGGIPGETVRIELTRQKKRWARGRLLEVLEASPDRAQPPCPHFGPCGGCQWQHIALPRQRAFKREIIISQLEHLGRLQDPPVREIRAVGQEDGFGYRNHAIFTLDHAGRTSYHREGSRDLVPVDNCPLLHPMLQDWHNRTPPLPGGKRLEYRVGTRTGQRLAMLQGFALREGLEEAEKAGIPLSRAGDGELTEMVGVERFRVSSKSFFQVNTDGAETLVELVLEALDPQDGQYAVDLCAGVGLFAIPVARKLGEKGQLWAVERSSASVRDLRHHSKKLPIHVVGVAMEEAAAQLPPKAHLVVADPPREGLGEAGVTTILGLEPLRIALVSCDPASLARDVAGLIEGGYTLDWVTPVDLFPQTFHVEAVARLSLVSKDEDSA